MNIKKLFKRIVNGCFTRFFCRFEKRRRGILSIYLNIGVYEAMCYLLCQKYINKKSHKDRKRKLDLVRAKQKIVVVFQVWNLGKWKCDSVYKAMGESKRFFPLVWITEDPAATVAQKEYVKNFTYKFFKENNYVCTNAATWEDLDKEMKPDIVFIQEPYAYSFNMSPRAIKHLLCYVRYGLPNTLTEDGTNLFLHNFCLFYFCENTMIASDYGKMMMNKGRNIVVTGHPIVDYLLDRRNKKALGWLDSGKEFKKVIWAPHWTIGNNSFYTASTFLFIANVMLKIAQRFSDSIQFTFKPHPTLYRELCIHPAWGKEKTDAYYSQWATMPNTQLWQGEYRNLFQQSDAMIHDCGSFVLEYLLMDKPCMYLDRGDGKQNFNNMNLEALKCYTIGRSEEDIESFIQEQVLGNYDPHADKRKAFCEKYLIPPHGKTAAENIIDAILGNHPYNQL